MTDAKITWDRDALAIYLQYSDAAIARTIAVSNSVCIDVDDDGNKVGMEILGVGEGIFAALEGIPESATLRDLIRNAA